jgi:hypothetical protein
MLTGLAPLFACTSCMSHKEEVAGTREGLIQSSREQDALTPGSVDSPSLMFDIPSVAIYAQAAVAANGQIIVSIENFDGRPISNVDVIVFLEGAPTREISRITLDHIAGGARIQRNISALPAWKLTTKSVLIVDNAGGKFGPIPSTQPAARSR